MNYNAKPKTRSNPISGLSLAVALVLGMPFANAETPSSLADLERADWDRVATELRSRGWTFIDSHWDNRLNGTVGYWWNGSRRDCVRTRTVGDTVRHIDRTAHTDCNQYGGHEEHRERDDDNSKAAAAAIGAAALIGIAALAHKSHHRDDDHRDERAIADFERGYRDGLHHYGYDYDNANDAYQDGYSKGRDEREHRGRYRDDRRGYDSGRDSGSAEWYTRLPGAGARGAASLMETNGFDQVDSFQSGNDGAGSVWYNPRTRQCLQMIVVDGRVDSAVDIRTHPRCR